MGVNQFVAPDSVRVAALCLLLAGGSASCVRAPPIAPPEEIVRIPQDILGDDVSADAVRHVIVRYARPTTPADRAAFEKRFAGARFLSPLPGNNYYLALPAAVPSVIPFDEELDFQAPVAIVTIEPEDKLASQLPDVVPMHALQNDGRLVVIVEFYWDVDVEQQTRLFERLDIGISHRRPLINGVQVVISKAQLQKLILEDSIRMIAPIPGPAVDDNEGVRDITGVNSDAVNTGAYAISGLGVGIAQWEQGIADNSHPDFIVGGVPRIALGSENPNPAIMTRHATHVAGTAIGSGTQQQQWKGIAFDATLISYQYDQGLLDFQYIEAASANANIVNQSFHTDHCHLSSNPGCYDQNSQSADAASSGVSSDGGALEIARRMLIVGSAGNQGRFNGGWRNTGIPNSAKNTIAVGAYINDTNQFWTDSSRGPTTDGRLKPDLVAPGAQDGGDHGVTSACPCVCQGPFTPDCPCSCQASNSPGNYYYTGEGTSSSAPAVTGVAALLTQWYRDACRLGDPTPSMLRAILIHTANDLQTVQLAGLDQVNFEGPDYLFGYGQVDALAAVGILTHHVEATINSDATHEFPITIANVQDFKVTLAWDDPPSIVVNQSILKRLGVNFSAEESLLLVNDLDLELEAPDGTIYTPWQLDPTDPTLPAVQSPGYSTVPEGVRDRRNTVEQVVIPQAAPGTWTIRILGNNLRTARQHYSVVSDLLEPHLVPLHLTPADADAWRVTQCDSNATDVWLRDNASDSGATPSSGRMWLSPAIWNRVDDDGGLPHQNPEFGEKNALYLRLRNRSPTEMAKATSVDVWIAPASTGLSWPINFRYVGRLPAPNLPAGNNRVIGPLLWDPPDPNPSDHFCFYVRAVNPQDPITIAEGTDVGANTQQSNNIVWRNVNVVDLVSTQSVTFQVRNIQDETAMVGIVIEIPEALLSVAEIELSLPPELSRQWAASHFAGSGFDETHIRDTPDRGRAIALRMSKVELGPIKFLHRQTHAVTLSVNPTTTRTTIRPDAKVAIDIVQRINGKTVGGIRYIAGLPNQ